MVPQIKALNQDEKDLMLDAIPLITLLIAYADGEMDDEERNWSEKIAHIRSYANHESLQEFYEKVGDHYQDKLDHMLETLPENNDQRFPKLLRDYTA